MALYVLTCLDKPGALDLRMASRPAHLVYLAEHAAMVKLAGPLLDDHDGVIGSLLIVEASDKASADAFASNDPYQRAGVFESVEARAWRVTIGALA